MYNFYCKSALLKFHTLHIILSINLVSGSQLNFWATPILILFLDILTANLHILFGVKAPAFHGGPIRRCWGFHLRRGNGVVIIVNNVIKLTFRRVHIHPLIMSFKLMLAVLTICSISLGLIVMPPSETNDLKLKHFVKNW